MIYDKNFEKIRLYLLSIEKNPAKITGEITKLCDKYGSDKGSFVSNHVYPWPPHTYSDIYEMLFGNIKNNKMKIFECGIGSNDINIPFNMSKNGIPGASLRVWRDYFPNSEIYGADIDLNVLFEEERIKTGFINQLEKISIKKYFLKYNYKFDIMIDDGLHTADGAICLFKNSFRYLMPNGFYIIEDLLRKDISKFCKFVQKYINKKMQIIFMDSKDNPQNNLIIIKKQKFLF